MDKGKVEVRFERIQWIDFAKGVAIFLVVFGHALEGMYADNPDNIVHVAIYSFHMPFFFMLSGIFFSDSKYSSLRKFSIKKFLTLIVPSYIFVIFTVLIRIVKDGGIQFGVTAVIRTLLQFRVEALANYWFLPTLFWAFMLMWIVHKIFKSDINRIVSSIILSSVGAMYIAVFARPLPFSFDNAMLVVLFMELGYQLKGRIDNIREKGIGIYIGLGVLWFASTYINYTFFGHRSISLAYVTLLNPVLFFASAISASFLMLMLCSKVTSKTRVNFWGKHTLVIYLVGGTVLGFVLSLLNKLDLNNNLLKIFICFVISAIVIEVSCIISIIIKKYCPFLLGEKRRKE